MKTKAYRITASRYQIQAEGGRVVAQADRSELSGAWRVQCVAARYLDLMSAARHRVTDCGAYGSKAEALAAARQAVAAL